MREVCFRHPRSAYLGGRHGGSIQTIHTVAMVGDIIVSFS